MPTGTFTFAQDFKEKLGTGTHNLSTHSFKAAFSNTTPNAATMAVLADITQISTGGGYTGGAGGGVALTTGYTETGGTGTFTASDVTVTATGGSIGPFRYVWIYNDTATSDPLVGYIDYGSAITVADTEQFVLDFGASVFTLS